LALAHPSPQSFDNLLFLGLLNMRSCLHDA
jgi:hypothetical protein